MQKFLLIAILMICGCGPSAKQAAEQRLGAKEAFAQANNAFNSQDFEKAKPLYEQALATGRLFGDSVGAAEVKLVICLAKLGDLAAASEKLDALEQQAPNMGEVMAARSYVLGKQGKAKEAKSAWSKARQFNSQVQKITD